MSGFDMNGDGIVDSVLQDTYGDGVADAVGFDTDQNGVIEAASIDSNNNSVTDSYIYDTNQNGVVDTFVIDADENGYADQVIFDSNENGLDDAAESYPGNTVVGHTYVGGAATWDGIPNVLNGIAQQTGSPTWGSPDSDSDGFADPRDPYPTDPTR